MAIKDPRDNNDQLLRFALHHVAHRSGMPCDIAMIGAVAGSGAAAVLAETFLNGLEEQLRSHLAVNAQPHASLLEDACREDSPEVAGDDPRATGEAAADKTSASAGEPVLAEQGVESGVQGEPNTEQAPPAPPAAPIANAGSNEPAAGLSVTQGEPSGGQAADRTQAEPAAAIASAEPVLWKAPEFTTPASAEPVSATAAPKVAPSAAPVAPPAEAEIHTQGGAMLNTITRPQGDRPSLQFQAANAKQGQPYRGALTAKPERNHVITQVLGPAGADVHVDSETGEIVGTFAEAGDIKLEIEYRFVEDAEHVVRSSALTLAVIPDPKLMWKNIPSDESVPFWKKDCDHDRRQDGDARLIAASQRGRSHAHKGTCRDDDFFIGTSNGWRIAVVADGAGSARFSRRGAQIAANEAGRFLIEKLTDDSELLATAQAVAGGNADAHEKLRRGLFSVVGHAAHTAMLALEKETKSATTPAVELRDLNTTLLIAISRPMGDHTVVGTWTVGDGAVGILSGGDRVELGGVPDGGEFSGGTRFLAPAYVEPQELLNRTKAFVREGVEAIVLMTDGVSDPMFKNDRALESREAWDALLNRIRDEAQFDIQNPGLEDGVEARLVEWLNFWVTGEHDDRTLAFIW